MAQAAVDYGVEATTEFHAHPMFHGKEEWTGVPARARVGLFYKVINAILAEDVVILLRSVDARRLKRRQDREFYPVNFPTEQVCFQHILQRADRIARREATHALIIADNRSDRDPAPRTFRDVSGRRHTWCVYEDQAGHPARHRSLRAQPSVPHAAGGRRAGLRVSTPPHRRRVRSSCSRGDEQAMEADFQLAAVVRRG